LDKDTQLRDPLPASQVRPSCWSSLLYWVLYFGYALLGLYGWVCMGYAITHWYWLNYSGIHPGPLYLAVTGGVWGLVCTFSLVWIALRRPWYRLVGLGAALFLALTYWIDRLFIITNPGGSSNTLFATLFTLLLLAYVTLVLRPFTEVRSLFYK